MKHIHTILLFSLMSMLAIGCTDDEHFTSNPSARLTFSEETINFDTVFATIPTSTRSFWVFNKGNEGIRLASVRLEGGNQNGFRVNVDGQYLGPSTGFQVHDVEIRKGDSIRVFVELTSPSPSADITELTDRLLFEHQSGAKQAVELTATSWRATILSNYHVSSDEMFTDERPIVVYGRLTVDAAATLTLAPGTTLFFHGDAGMDVYGRLVCDGTAAKNVTLRGDRLDRMFTYLPYDGLGGQWQGVVIHEGSYDNVLRYTDLHGAMHGIQLTSDDPSRLSLTLDAATVHNCQGHGLKTVNAQVLINNTQMSNTLGDCLHAEGGRLMINNSTLAQFYPFDSARGNALYFNNDSPIVLQCYNSIITGYANDVLQGEQMSEENAFEYIFTNCLMRTPEPQEEHKAYFVDVIYEDTDNAEAGGEHNFIRVDIDSLRYDFRLADSSQAIDAANPQTALATDRDGLARGELPDMGCFERRKEESEQQRW